ncbi:mobilization protein, partial [uncultured Phocaeicola sp.]
ATWKPNLHAHIVWDWMNHDTGKSCKLDDKAMSDMQTLLAECLEMERGTSKEVTGKEHLERADFIITKQKQEAEQVKSEKEAAEADRDAAIRETDNARSEQEKLRIVNEEKQRRSAELDSEIAEKEERAREVDRENTDSIKSGIANLFGKGKYAAIEQENERLKAENEHIKESFPDEVRKEVAKRTKALTEAKRTVELERDSAMAMADTFESERDTALRQLREQKTGEQHRIGMAVSRATEEKDRTIRQLQGALKSSRDILNIIADILYKASEVFRRAIEAIIHFATERHKSIFSNDEAADIKSVMQSYGETTEQQKAVGAWLCDYAEHRQPFDEIKHRHTLNEVGDVAEGAYDWRIEKEQRGISL